MTKALLEASLQIQKKRHELLIDAVMEDYQWLTDLLHEKN